MPLLSQQPSAAGSKHWTYFFHHRLSFPYFRILYDWKHYSMCFFYIWLLSPRIMFVKFTHVTVCVLVSHNILLLSSIPLREYASCFTCSLSEGHLDCFQVWATVSKASVNKFYKSFCGHLFEFLLDTQLAVKLLGHKVDRSLTFKLLINNFHHFTLPLKRILIVAHDHQHLRLSVVFILPVLVCM